MSLMEISQGTVIQYTTWWFTKHIFHILRLLVLVLWEKYWANFDLKKLSKFIKNVINLEFLVKNKLLFLCQTAR